MKIKHHNIFKIYLPKNTGENEEKITPEMFLEEAYLWSNGSITPDFKPNDFERNELDVVLYPSFIFAAKKLHQTETEQTEFINKRIDVEFCKMLLWIKPIYRLNEFVDYHFNKYEGDKNIFLKHIKFVIVPLIKTIIENNSKSKVLIKEEYPDFSIVSEIILSWILAKEELLNPKDKVENSKFETTIKKAKNVIVNNDSQIKNQNSTFFLKSKKSKILVIIGLVISVLMLIIAVVTNWDKLF